MEQCVGIRERIAFVGNKVSDRILGKRISESQKLPGIDCRSANGTLRRKASVNEREDLESDLSVLECGVRTAEESDARGHRLRKLAFDRLHGLCERLLRHAKLSRPDALEKDAKGGESGRPGSAALSHLPQMRWFEVRAMLDGIDIEGDGHFDCGRSCDMHRNARSCSTSGLNRRP